MKLSVMCVVQSLQKGTTITQGGIRILKTWGVLEINIDEASAAEHRVSHSAQLDPDSLKKASVETAILFQYADRNNAFVNETHGAATINCTIKSGKQLAMYTSPCTA